MRAIISYHHLGFSEFSGYHGKEAEGVIYESPAAALANYPNLMA